MATNGLEDDERPLSNLMNQSADSSRESSTEIEQEQVHLTNDQLGVSSTKAESTRTLSPKNSAQTTHGNNLHAEGSASPISENNENKNLSVSSGRIRGYSLRRQLLFRRTSERLADDETVQISSKTQNGKDLEMQPMKQRHNALQEKEKNGGSLLSPNYMRASNVSRGEKKQKDKNVIIAKFGSLYQWFRKLVLHINEMPSSKGGRKLPLSVCNNRAKNVLDDERTGKHYVNNSIRSSRYTLWDFLPRQLFYQFSKIANFYFLCISILQLIPNLSTTGRLTTFIPLCIFVSLSMAKEGFDDYRRYKQDRVENNRFTRVLELQEKNDGEITETWLEKKWRSIKVGDIVKLERDENIPADIVLLSTDGIKGTAYVETAALDGETNLKGKQELPLLSDHYKDQSRLGKSNEEITVEDPNTDLYNFEGKVSIGKSTKPLTNNQVLYRGSTLRNTPKAIGLVIFTGEETKIRMNANKRPRTKAPAIQKAINRVVLVIVCFVLFLATYHTIAYILWRRSTERKSWYLKDATVALFPIFASYVIMFNTLIPLSLYVSLEIVKVCQILLLNDIDMYDEVTNTPFEPRTSTINEELGQISYIFSDKTGTLTDNVMIFRRVSIAGYAWAHDPEEEVQNEDISKDSHLWHKRRYKASEKKRKSKMKSMNLDNDMDLAMPNITSSPTPPPDPRAQYRKSKRTSWRASAIFPKELPLLSTKDLLEYLQTQPHTQFARKARMFLMCVSLCHTCLPEKMKNGEIKYQAASPDEIALVQAAKELNYVVMDREGESITINTFPNGRDNSSVSETYRILDVIEFSSKRKRMSIILRFPNGKICLMTKGADSIMTELLRLQELALEKAVEVGKLASKRRSIDAQEFLRRNSVHRQSTQINRKSGVSRSSTSGLATGRPSIKSKTGTKKEELDAWLKSRRDTVEVQNSNGEGSNRPSEHYDRRYSLAIGEVFANLERDTSGDIIDDQMTVNDNVVFERCFQHIHEFASEGLRTLVYGFRFLDEEDYSDWKKIYSEATTSLVNRQDLIEDAAEQIERDLELAGATGIEDKLQQGVPETVDKLRRANIKIWMLTGDKRETAVNIGHSCHLVKEYSEVMILDMEEGTLEQTMTNSLNRIKRSEIAHSVVVVDGATLAFINDDGLLNSMLFDLTVCCDAVICCRASPNQKAALVRSIRKRVKKAITLAIGDGANDIAMIQEAHVGIGITGKEGLAAARSSDYSIAQFRFLLKLLLVHGRWNYVRTSKYVLGTFWKEMLFYLVQAQYQIWNGYTGTSLYEPWSLAMFNTLFTSLPVIFMGVFEKDLAASTLLAVPELYVYNKRSYFNVKSYVGWMFVASCQAVIVFYSAYGLYAHSIILNENGIFGFGVLCYTAVVIIVVTKLQIVELHNKSIAAVIAFILSVGGWFMWNGAICKTFGYDSIYNVKEGISHQFGRDLRWWTTLLYLVSACVIFDLAIIATRVNFFPTEVDDFQAIEKDVELRKRLEEEASFELQQGWQRGKKRTSGEIEREQEVEEILKRRDDNREAPTGLERIESRAMPDEVNGSTVR